MSIKFYNDYINQLKERFPNDSHLWTWDALKKHVEENHLVDKEIKELADYIRDTGDCPGNRNCTSIDEFFTDYDECLDLYFLFNNCNTNIDGIIEDLKETEEGKEADFFYIYDINTLSPLTLDWNHFADDMDELTDVYKEYILEPAVDQVTSELSFENILYDGETANDIIAHAFIEENSYNHNIADLNNGRLYDLDNIKIFRNAKNYIPVESDDYYSDKYDSLTSLTKISEKIITHYRQGVNILMLSYDLNKNEDGIYKFVTVHEPCDVIFYDYSKAVIKILNKEDSNE